MDIVAALAAGRVTADTAEGLLNDRIQAWVGSPEDLDGFVAQVGMSRREYTAYLHGATLVDIAELRARGWPDSCAKCGRPIDYQAGFWLLGANEVNCIECPDHPAADVVPWVNE